MNAYKFLESMSNLGYEVITNSQFELEGEEYRGYRVRHNEFICYIVPDTVDKVKLAVIKNESNKEEINLLGEEDRSYKKLYDVLKVNVKIFQDKGNLESISGELNKLYKEVRGTLNPVDIQYSGEFIGFRGVASEEDIKAELTEGLERRIRKVNKESDIGLYFLVKTTEVLNETTVNDIENFLHAIRVYLVRVDVKYKETLLDDIFDKVLEEGNYSDSPESIVSRVYNLPVIEEGKKARQDSEELRGNKDNKDKQRLRRFVEYLSDNKIRYKMGNNKDMPIHLIVDLAGIQLIMSPTFVIYYKGNKVIYNKYNENKGYQILQRSIINILNKEGVRNKSEVEYVIKVIKAYLTSNDLRKTVR